MSKTNKAVAWVIGIIIVVLIIVLAQRGGAGNQGTIKIGYIDPLTGGAADYGFATKGGVALAVKEINENGGINGRQVEVIYEDGKCNGVNSASAAQKLVAIDKVKYIIGMTCSGEVLGISPMTEKSKVFLLVQGSSPDITHAGKYIVRTSPSDLFSGQAIAEHSVATRLKKAAVIVENTEYSTALNAAFQKTYSALGGTVLDTETYAPDTTDFRSVLTKMKSLKPDMLFIDAQSSSNAARIAKQARDIGITSQFYSAFVTGPEYVASGSAVNGTYIVDVPSLKADNPKAKEFNAKFKTLTGTDSPYPFYSAAAYDQFNMLMSALKKYDYSDTEAVRNYIHSISSYDGVIGPFHFDENGDVAGISLRLVQVVDDKVVDVK